MSLCLMTSCDSDQSIACVVDERFTTDESAGDVIRKHAKFGNTWIAAFAGQDTSHAGPLIDGLKLKFLNYSPWTYDDIQTEFLRLNTKTRTEIIESSILKNLGRSQNDFLSNGREKLGVRAFNTIMRQASLSHQIGELGSDPWAGRGSVGPTITAGSASDR